MEKTISPSKSALQVGVLFGIIMISELVISFVLNIGTENKTYGTIISLLNYLILPFTFIFVACNNYKKNINNGFISFGECIKIGMSVAFIASLLYGIFYIVFTMIFPEFIPDLIDKITAVTVKENPNMTQEQLDMSLSIVKKMMDPYITAPLAIVMNCFISLIHSLIIGAIVKNERPISH
jgi:FlaA1/EpsC-like NDP-sugar epimerase